MAIEALLSVLVAFNVFFPISNAMVGGIRSLITHEVSRLPSDEITAEILLEDGFESVTPSREN